MKFFHTADWHLGKLVQGVYMTEDQRYILQAFIEEIKKERPDAVIIAGDLYDRAIPPTDAVKLLNEVLQTIVIELQTPVIAVAGNHDSPSRLQFGSTFMKEQGLFLAGELCADMTPAVLEDEYGEVHFHLVPFADPSVVSHILNEEAVSHQQAMEAVVRRIEQKIDKAARHIFVGHAFVTPDGGQQNNTSDAERPLAIGGAEYVSSQLFAPFHYTALGHLHRAHYAGNETIRYSGSPLKYSISEENHEKGFLIIELDGEGKITAEKRLLIPKHEVRTVSGTLEQLLQQERNEDYVFVELLDTAPVIQPMEKIRSVFPNAMHIERKQFVPSVEQLGSIENVRKQQDDRALFSAFFKQLEGEEADEDMQRLFEEVLLEVNGGENR